MHKKMTKMEAWLLGFKDGYVSPSELSSGMTWDDDALNEAYDKGVNVGQRIGSKVKNVPCEAN